MTDKRETRAWVDIDLDALAHNYQSLRNWVRMSEKPGEPVKLLGMVKANAYGHGAPAIGRKLQELGAEMLAVACLDEAVQLRQAGVTIPILCLGQTPVELAEDLMEDGGATSPSRWATWSWAGRCPPPPWPPGRS